MKISYKIIARKDFVNKDGKAPVYLRLIINRKVKKYSLNISVNPKFWDQTKARLDNKHIEAEQINLKLFHYTNKANTILFNYSVSNKQLTHSIFENEFFNTNVSSSFYDFIKSEIENDIRLKPETKRFFNADLSKIKKFKAELTFAEVDMQLLMKYEKYMYEVLGNRINTVHKSMKFIRNFINRAMLQNYITESPFRYYKMKTEATTREFLTMEEINRLDKKKLNKRLRNVLNYFMFCCFTGLRYQDILNLRYKNIKDNNILQIVTHKTEKKVRIPLTNRALKLIDDIDKHLPEERIFRVATNNVCNRYLKELMTLAEIDKRISFHCSRHTFATNALNLGIPLDVVSELLGTDIRIAKVYAKMLDNIKIEQMQKFNQSEVRSRKPEAKKI